MNRDLPKLPSFVFILSILLCIVMYMHRVEQLSLPVVSQFIETSEQTKLVFGDKLIGLNPQGSTSTLNDIGVSNHTGLIGVSRNREQLFINTGGQDTTIIQNVRRFLRIEESAAKGKLSSLLACDSGLSCTPWGADVLNFDSTWSLHQTANGQFIIADTARHQLHLINSQGEHLDVLRGFNFPNHVFEYNSSPWVVDTNTNSLIELDTSDSQLEKTGASIRLADYEGIAPTHRFPSMAIATGGQELLVLTHTSKMNRGQMYLLSDGHARRLFASLKDITTFHLSGKTLYAADYHSQQLWEQSLNQAEPKQRIVPAYESAVVETKKRVKAEWRGFIFDAACVALVGLLALVIALVKSTPHVNAPINVAAPNKPIIEPGGKVVWVKKDVRFAKTIKRMVSTLPLFLIFIPLPPLAIWYVVAQNQVSDELSITILVVCVFSVLLNLGLFWVTRFELKKLQEAKIGWDGVHIYLSNHKVTVKANPSTVLYSRLALFSQGLLINIQSLGSQHFDKQSFETIIAPLLSPEQRRSHMNFMTEVLKAGHRPTVIRFISTLVFTIGAVVLLLAIGF